MSAFIERDIWTPEDAKQLVGRRVRLRDGEVMRLGKVAWLHGEDDGSLYSLGFPTSLAFVNYTERAEVYGHDIVAYEGPAIGHTSLVYVQELEEENQRLKGVLEAVKKAIGDEA